MIRILHSVSNMDRAGLETMLMNYYRKMDRSKIQFDFVCNKKKLGAYDEEIRQMGGRIFRSPGLNPLKFGSYINFFKKLVRENPEYKVLEVHNETLGYYALVAGRLAGIKTRIFHAHASSIDKDYKYPLKAACKPMIKHHDCLHFTCSKKAARFFYGDKIVDNNDFTIIKNAIDIDRFNYNIEVRDRMRKENGLDGKLVIGHIGRFMGVKNHAYVLRIFKAIKDRKPDAVLVLLGEGSLMDNIRCRAESMGLADSVKFIGNVGNANEWYQAFDVFVLPSINEGLPVVGIEAQAAGLPCLFSDTISKELGITDRACFLSIYGDPEVWADKALEMVKEERRVMEREITEAGYDINVEAAKLQEMYINLYGK